MGRETRSPRAFKMKYFFLLLILTLLFLNPSAGVPSDESTYLSKWLELLDKGNENEKKLVLIELPGLLRYPEIQDKTIFNGILQALKDKNPSIRATAAACVKQFGRFHPGDLEEKERIALQRELVKKGDSHLKKTFPESLSYHEARNLIVPHLLKALSDKEPMVREEAAKALAFYKNVDTTDELIKSLHDKDPWVKVNVVFALGELKALKAVDPLLNLLEDDSDWRNKFVQQECVIAIRKIESQEASHKKGSTAVQAGTLQGARAAQQVRQKALDTGAGIVGLDDQTAARVISAFISKFDDPYLKPEIIRAINDFKILGARKLLIEATQDPNDRIRELAGQALLELSLALREWVDSTPPSPTIDDPNVEVFIRLLADPAVKIRAQSVLAFGRLMDTRAIGPLIEASQDRSEQVREKVIVALGNFADERILDVAVSLIMSDPQPNLRDLACDAFRSVSQKTAKRRVFVYRENGIRYVSKDMSEKPWGIKASERLVHPTAVKKLIDLIGHPDEKAKRSALNLFPRFEDERIEGVILKHLDDPSPQLRKKAISIIPYFSGSAVVPRLIIASRDKHSEIREKAVRALGAFEDKRGLEPLIERLSDTDPEVRTAALDSLETYDDPRLSGLAINLLRDDSLSVRKAAVLNIKQRRDRKAVEALALLLEEADNEVVDFTVEALEAIGDQRATDTLIKALKGEFNKNRAYGGDATLRMNAAKALGSIKDHRAVPALIECLSEDDPFLRRRVASALKKIEDPAGLEAIKNIPKDELPPEIGSATPVRPADVKRPPPSAAIPREYSPGSGFSVLHFGRDRKTEEKQSPPKVIALHPLYQTKALMKIGNEPKTILDIKSLMAKLKSTDPRTRREAADKLGDAGSQETTDHLIPLLKDKDEYVRQAAARTLGKLKDKRAVEPLIFSSRDPEINVRAFSIWALGEIQDTRAIEPLCSLLLYNEEKIRNHSFEALRKFREPVSRSAMVNTLIKNAKVEPSAELMLSRLISLEGKEVVLKALEDPSGERSRTVRNYINLMEANIYFNVSDIAARALEEYPDRGIVISELASYISTQTGTLTRSISLLGHLKDRRVLPILLDALNKRKDSYSRATVIKAIEELGDKEAAEPLLQILMDDKEYSGIRIAAARALGKFGDARAVEPLLKILKDERENKEVRRDAASALGTFRDKRAVEPLINILKSRNEDIWLRVAAASSLGNIGDQRAIEPLLDSLQDPSDYIRNAAQTALQKIRSPQ
jgi:HEAT repeat protein